MINIGQYIETAMAHQPFRYILRHSEHRYRRFYRQFPTRTVRHPLLHYHHRFDSSCLDKVGQRNSRIYHFGTIAYLRNGLLGRNHADISPRIVIHLSCTAAGRAIRHLDCQQQSV